VTEKFKFMDKPILSKQAFWDVDMDKIDYEKNALDLIERVMYRGSFEDFRALVKFYGDEKVCKEIIHTKRFGAKEVNFCCLIFKIKPTYFKYYKKGQSKVPPEFAENLSKFNYYN